MTFLPSNINELINSISQTGIAYNNRYEVLVNYPKTFPTKDPQDLRQIMIRCDSATIPGRSFSTTPYRLYGPARNMPYEQIYSGELNLSVVLSADLRERAFFETWMSLISSPSNYKFAYYEDYISNMEISVITKNDFATHKFIVEEVYPKALGDIQLGYEKDNEVMRQDITLSFRKYTAQYIGPGVNPAVAASGSAQSAPQAQVQNFVNGPDGKIYRVGADGTVNGLYDPQTAFSLMNGGAPTRIRR